MKTSNKILVTGSVILLAALLAGMVYTKQHFKPAPKETLPEMTNEEADLENFHSLAVTGNYNVELLPGNPHISIETYEEDQEKPVMTIKDSILYIGNNDGSSGGENQKITVRFPSLKALSLTGNGEINSAQPIQAELFRITLTGNGHISALIRAKKIECMLTGNGSVTTEGSCDELDVQMTGNGDADFNKTTSSRAHITVNGQGTLNLNTSEKITGSMIGNGTLRYKGNPALDVSKLGNGVMEKSENTEL